MNAGQLCPFHCAMLPANFCEVVEKHDLGISGRLDKSMKIMPKSCWQQTICPNDFYVLPHFVLTIIL